MADENAAAPQNPDSMEGALAQWRNYKQKAESGEFRMDHEIGDALRNRAETMLKGIEDVLLVKANDVAHLSGFGTLPSAQALQAKFQNKAVSDNDSAANQLKKHIDLLMLMRDTYALSIRKLTDTDQANANQFNQTDV
ncbi:hypothetical protein APR11_006438 [Nocardia amikacinitolerans]|uniref:hypothetical protein n=1 Tax=Nocardia amikacinitolerans TaxID=756689 RepID=UPI0020A58BDD|nr:hypothetical protein [Nocardia amikacinitolerans]MCP2299975.1 hypothetical protein [Nocardia amikacinitolerans]